MKCSTCGDKMQKIVTDLPFKTGDRTIVIIKSVPVLQCDGCADYLIEDAVMQRIDEILAQVTGDAELEVIPFAA